MNLRHILPAVAAGALLAGCSVAAAAPTPAAAPAVVQSGTTGDAQYLDALDKGMIRLGDDPALLEYGRAACGAWSAGVTWAETADIASTLAGGEYVLVMANQYLCPEVTPPGL